MRELVAVALTGIIATMPYIALQLVGIKAVLTVLGLGSNTNPFMADLPLIIAFVVLAAYTYTGGLRAPALIAIVKDVLIYIAIIVAIAYLPAHFGGWEGIFGAAEKKLTATNPATGSPFGAVIPGAASFNAYWTLALGSAIATGQQARLHDAVVLKTLGATRNWLVAAYALEFGLLGALACGFAVVAGSVAAYGIVEGLMRMDFVFRPDALAATTLAALLVTLALGLAGTWRTLSRKPGPELRDL